MFENIYLEPEQIDLFCEMVEDMRSVPREDRKDFKVSEIYNGDFIYFQGHPGTYRKIYMGDLEELARQGLLAKSYYFEGLVQFAVTSIGYRYYDYIKQNAKTSTMDEIQAEPNPPDLNIHVGNSIKVSNSHEKSTKPIFLSYAREDQLIVEEIRNKLSQDGFIYWFDRENLLAGDDWEDKILEAIENAQFVLVFLSTRSITKTGYYQKEVRYILEQSKHRPKGKRYIIPILLEPCEPPREFREYHRINIWEKNAYDKLKKALLGEQYDTTMPEFPLILDTEELTILSFLDTTNRRTPEGIHSKTGIEIPVVKGKLQDLLDKGLVELEIISNSKRWSISFEGHNFLLH